MAWKPHWAPLPFALNASLLSTVTRAAVMQVREKCPNICQASAAELPAAYTVVCSLCSASSAVSVALAIWWDSACVLSYLCYSC